MTCPPGLFLVGRNLIGTAAINMVLTVMNAGAMAELFRCNKPGSFIFITLGLLNDLFLVLWMYMAGCLFAEGCAWDGSGFRPHFFLLAQKETGSSPQRKRAVRGRGAFVLL